MRRFLTCLAACLGLLAVAAVTLPWWLGFALGWVGPRQGITFARYERVGFTRAALTEVTLVRPGVTAKVDRVEAPIWGWLAARTPLVAIGTWSVELTPRQDAAPPSSAGWRPLRAQLQRVRDGLLRWLPEASVGAGAIRGTGWSIALDGATWTKGELAATGVRWEDHAVDLRVAWPADTDRLTLLAQRPDQRIEVRSEADRVELTWSWAGQTATGEASFAETGWLPREAGLRAEDWTLPGTHLGLGAYAARVLGGARLDWRDGQLTIDARASSEPVPGQAIPPLTAQLRAGGSAQAITVEEFALRIPGATATLSAPLTLALAREVVWSGLRPEFRLVADLTQVPWPGWSGKVEGRASLRSREGERPVVDVQLSATEVGRAEWRLPDLTLAASIDGPHLTVNELVIETPAVARLVGRGAWDFSARRLTAGELTGRVDRTWVARWLPTSVTWGTLDVALTGEGDWPRLNHAGTITVDGIHWAAAKPVAGTIRWQGTGAQADVIDADLRASGANLRLQARAASREATVTALTLTRSDGRRLEQQGPVHIRWGEGWQVAGVRLRGDATEVDADGDRGATGAVTVRVTEFDRRWIDDWWALSGSAWTVRSARASGRLGEGAVEGQADLALDWALDEKQSVRIALAATADANGIGLTRLDVGEGETVFLRAEGQVPLTIWPGAVPRVRLDPEGAVSLKATTHDQPLFWNRLRELTGVALERPDLAAELAGTWSRPTGQLRLVADRVRLDPARWPRAWPELTALTVQASANGERLTLDEFGLAIAGQSLAVTGEFPLGRDQWEQLARTPWTALAESGTLRVRIPDADLSVLSSYTSAVLAPTGRLSADLTLQPGMRGEGWVRLRDAATRPLGPLGALQEITADLTLAERTINVNSLSARTGGQPVQVRGRVELSPESSPRYDLTLRGENLPFVRQAGLLVRGDLDLSLRSQGAEPPLIGGTVRLRDSLFLADVRSLLPSGGRGGAPARRPPYFSVDIPPLATWRLGVDLRGERFLRLRTPVFNGVASARFRLGGTLGDPRATGEATMDEGQIVLPFAAFDLRQGVIRLTSADPFEPQLAVSGTSRRYGYDLRLEVTGPASNPGLTFTSSPALSSEQVLLMVMAGEVPGDEIRASASQRAVRFGAFLGRGLIGRLGGDSERADRLSLTAGERVSRQGRETYGFEYRLDPRWSLVGEYDEFDDYNAGVKWRIVAREREEASDVAK